MRTMQEYVQCRSAGAKVAPNVVRNIKPEGMSDLEFRQQWQSKKRGRRGGRADHRDKLRKQYPCRFKPGVGVFYGLTVKICALRVAGLTVDATAEQMGTSRIRVVVAEARLEDSNNRQGVNHFRQMAAALRLEEPEAIAKMLVAETRKWQAEKTAIRAAQRLASQIGVQHD